MDRDIVVIGGGPGGYVAAIRGAQLGAKVSLVEKDRLGGTCLNRGCIPTKALYKNAQIINTLSHVEDFGIQVGQIRMDIGKAQDRKQAIVEKLVGGINQLMQANGIEVASGTAKILDAHTVEVTAADGSVSQITAKNILIATGSVPVKPPVEGMDLPGVITSDEMLEMSEVPGKAVIIGGGVIGIEFAGILQAFGSEVHVIEFLPSIIPTMDSDLGKRLAMSLKKKGIQIDTGAKVTNISQNGGKLVVKAEGAKGKDIEAECDLVLVSTGRRPFLDGLNLDGVGVTYDRTGVKVDEDYCTNVPGIYAIGDAIGGVMLAHVASEEAMAAVAHMMGKEGHVNYNGIPGCVFTFPEVASVGLTEEEAKARERKYTVSKFLFGANGKAMTMNEADGLVKVMADPDTYEIIGVHILGPNANDLIHEAVLAINNGVNAKQVAETIHAHPSLSEAFWEATSGILNMSIHSAPAKKK